MIGHADILVLDEPTSSVTAEEEHVLFDAVRDVTAAGAPSASGALMRDRDRAADRPRSPGGTAAREAEAV